MFVSSLAAGGGGGDVVVVVDAAAASLRFSSTRSQLLRSHSNSRSLTSTVFLLAVFVV